MSPLVLLAPFFALCEVAQLVAAERYLGIKQIERNVDPRTLGPGELASFGWTLGIVVYLGWMLSLLTVPFARLQAICLIAITALGFFARRNTTLAWTLVILTFEAALRIGMLLSLLGLMWRQL
jgi:hypothetical protein